MSTSNVGRLHVKHEAAEATANNVGSLLVSLRMARIRFDKQIPTPQLVAAIAELDLRIATLEAVHKSLLGDGSILAGWQSAFQEVLECR